MRRHSFTKGEYYHIYCHGSQDLKIFRSRQDFERFLVLLFAANGDRSIPRLDRVAFPVVIENILSEKSGIGKPLVDLVAFCIVPTHIHFLLKEKSGDGISMYMHKLLVSHSKYINRKYDRRGHVFESTFHSRHIDTNQYLVYLSRYIHKNPKDDTRWHGKEVRYPWSSYQDFVIKNRWGSLIKPDIILEQFADRMEYSAYVEEPLEDDKWGLDIP